MYRYILGGCRQVVRHQLPKLIFAGSNPVVRSISMSRTIIKNIINVFIIVTTLCIFVWGVFIAPIYGNPTGLLGKEELYGLKFFRFYTNLSNLFIAITCALNLFIKPKRWLVVLTLCSIVCVALTFLVVIGFLGPGEVLKGKSYFSMFENDMLFFHLINPILVFISFCFLQKEYKMNVRDCALACIPTIIYGFVYLVCVLTNTWIDFYQFTFGGQFFMIPIVFVIILIAVFLLSLLIASLHNKGVKSERENNKNYCSS